MNKLIIYISVFLLLFSASSVFNAPDAMAQEVCPVDIAALDIQVDQTIPALNDTLALVNQLLDTLAPIEALDTTGALDPLAGQLLDIVNQLTAQLNTLELYAASGTDEKCAIAADICVQSQSLFTLIGNVPGIVDSTLGTALPVPIVGDLLNSILGQVFGVTDLLLGTLDPLTSNLISISCSQEQPAEMCEVVDGSPVCADPACSDQEITDGLTCNDFNMDPEGSCGDTVSCDDPNCQNTESCPAPECEFKNGSPNCADPLCAVEDVADGVTCDQLNQDPEGYCGNEVSCDDPNCVEAATCNSSQPPAGGGGGCTLSSPSATPLTALLLPLMIIGGVYISRKIRSRNC